MHNKPKKRDCIDSIIDAIIEPFEVLANGASDCFDSNKNDFNLGEFLGKLFCCSEPKTKENQTPPAPTTVLAPANHRTRLGISPNLSNGGIKQDTLTPTASPMIIGSTRRTTPKVLQVRPFKDKFVESHLWV